MKNSHGWNIKTSTVHIYIYTYILYIIYTVYIRLSPLPVTVACLTLYQGSPTKNMTVTGQGDNSIYMSIYIYYIYIYDYICIYTNTSQKQEPHWFMWRSFSNSFSKESGGPLALQKKHMTLHPNLPAEKWPLWSLPYFGHGVRAPQIKNHGFPQIHIFAKTRIELSCPQIKPWHQTWEVMNGFKGMFYG